MEEENDKGMEGGKTDEISDDIKDQIRKAEEQITEEEKPTEEKGRRKRRGGFLLIAVLVIFVVSCFYNYYEMRKLRSPIEISARKRIDDVNIHFYLVSLKIEQYKTEHGYYPGSLMDEIGEEDLQYILHPDNSYELIYQLDDSVLTYSSKEDPGRLLSEEFLDNVIGRREESE